MAVMLVTSVGELVIDLFTDQCPLATKNFLKLCKIKYYNNCLFHSVQKDFIVQTGDPTATGKGGDSVYKLLYGDQARFFDDEIHPTLKHDKVGIVAMASAGENANASQFYITTGAELDNLDEKHTVFGEVGKGLEALSRINEAFVDDNNRPYKNIRIKHTIILEDPFDDPAGLSDLIPDQSPELKPPVEGEEVRLEDDWVPRDETMDPEEMEKALRKKEAESRAADEIMDTGPAVDGDYYVKDEELVDFEGSDYGFESGDEEASAADDEAQAPPPPLPSKPSKDSVAHFNAEAKADGVVDVQQPPVVPVFFVVVDDPPKHKSLRPKPDLEDGELDDAAMRDISSNYSFESAVSCRMGLNSASLPSYGNETNSAAKPTVVIENLRRRWLGLIKLLSEAEGMFKSVGGDPIYSESPKLPEGSDPEAVANGGDDDEGENDRRERKRRKDRYAAERLLDNRGRRDAEETALAHSRQFRGRSSDKMHGSQRSNYSRGSKGANAAPFQRGNSGPGIMGPGRPAVSMEYGGHMSSRSFGRGIPRPVGGMAAPGRLNQNEVNMQNHMRDSMVVQEHMLRQQQFMQMAQEQVQQVQAHAQAQGQAQVQARARAQAQAQVHAHAQVQQAHAHAHAQAQVHMANYGTIRASLSGSTMRPMMGLELIGGQLQGSHGMMHLQVQKPDSGPQVNYPRLLEGFGTRAPPSADFAAGRISGGGLLLNQASNRDRTVSGRQPSAWAPSSAIYHEVSSMPAARGRAHGQGRGQVMSPQWAEPPVGGIPAGFPSPLGVIGHAVPVNVSPGGVVALGTPKRQGSLPMVIPHHTATNRENANMKKADIRPQVDGTWRTNGDNRGSVHHNGTPAPYSRNDSAVWSKSSSGGQFGNKRSRENGLDRRHSSKTVTVSSVGNGMETAGNHLIQLGGPVTKSRMLSVSGFPENTSMAAVVEAFEKQGKILEFKKNDKGNAFHITFSSVAEAVSAKRSLHRTLLNGRQITVDYTVQGY